MLGNGGVTGFCSILFQSFHLMVQKGISDWFNRISRCSGGSVVVVFSDLHPSYLMWFT